VEAAAVVEAAVVEEAAVVVAAREPVPGALEQVQEGVAAGQELAPV
jgi:hypothetical protein